MFKPHSDDTTTPPHPGEILREHLLPRLDMSAADLARHIGLPAATLDDFLAERRPVDVALAVLLGTALGEGARFWLSLQVQHDLWLAEQADAPRIEPIDWARRGRRTRPARGSSDLAA